MSDFLYKKHFSLNEARATLPSAVPLVEKIVSLKLQLDERGYDIHRHQYFGGMGPNGQKIFPEEMERLVLRVRELHDRGIEIKDEVLETLAHDRPMAYRQYRHADGSWKGW